jgi:hypothetical protein
MTSFAKTFDRNPAKEYIMTETTQWEYQTKTFGSLLLPMDDDELEDVLDQWGEEGWEVVAAYAIPGTYKFRIIAKRPLSQSTGRERSRPGSS